MTRSSILNLRSSSFISDLEVCQKDRIGGIKMSGLTQFFKEQSKALRTALFVVAFLSGVAFGQNESGRINGRISDPNGAVVTGGVVQAKSIETGIERLATTSGEGFYLITNLPPG